MKSKRTKALSITTKVKHIVFERDYQLCIFCQHAGNPEAHVIPRSAGGLGIETNIITVCRLCHRELDIGKNRKKYLEYAKGYLKHKYPDWNEKDQKYRKV
jgi:hypothetical protein